MKSYNLVNPYIKGSFETQFKGKTELDAASNAWESLGKNIKQSLPKFSFTLERSSDKKLFTFTVKETVSDGLIDFKLGRSKPTKSRKRQTAFKNKLKELRKLDKKQKGGQRKRKKKKKDDSSSSSDDSDDMKAYAKSYKKTMNKLYNSYPISYYWYDPLYYDDSKFVPSLVGYPYVYYSYAETDDLSTISTWWPGW